jgi:hypothetical protein
MGKIVGQAENAIEPELEPKRRGIVANLRAIGDILSLQTHQLDQAFLAQWLQLIATHPNLDANERWKALKQSNRPRVCTRLRSKLSPPPRTIESKVEEHLCQSKRVLGRGRGLYQVSLITTDRPILLFRWT